ncbi:unnamed protein product (macronuclear) [Paramecium tetraurelia]|uniref:Transmembrane protein n=1 Tax=Paramecium tetraurelia TaxID=5888 RepID=A0CBL7_PARTE|nr:uncharacterized protein GSPATT00036967001 [Paramecium tetraurelia]CAK68184.1 unnamed protein product [Paramecium tetraurelia]|eukprot:XP_001435581.1 hypothetical protein (macronuclear) [Paramecium tetraurelia strain d4-2]
MCLQNDQRGNQNSIQAINIKNILLDLAKIIRVFLILFFQTNKAKQAQILSKNLSIAKFHKLQNQAYMQHIIRSKYLISISKQIHILYFLLYKQQQKYYRYIQKQILKKDDNDRDGYNSNSNKVQQQQINK